MIYLLSFPEELLVEIVAYLEYDRHTLVSLSSTCRRFNRLTRALVFRHVILSRPMHDTQKQRPLLERSFADDPELRNSVWTIGPIKMNHHNYISTASLQLLERFPNLKSLCLNCDRYSGNGYQHSILDADKTANIKNVIVRGSACENTLRIIFLPRIQEIQFDDFQLVSSQPSISPMMSEPFHESTVKTLKLYTKLNHTSSYDGSKLAEFLDRCPALDKLVCHLPIEVEHLRNNFLEHKFQPERIYQDLKPVQTTLKVLDLQIPCPTISSIRGSPLDLTTFVALTSLRVDSVCLVPFRVSDLGREQVHKCLPQSLRDLQIDFKERSYVFYEPQELQSARVAKELLDLPEERFKWLLQFPTHKEMEFPGLRQVVLKESWANKYRLGRKWDRYVWTARDDINAAYKEARIKLSIMVYA